MKPNFIKSIFLLSIILSPFFCYSQNYSTLYFYRKKKLTATGVDFKVYINKLEVGQILNGGRLEYRYYKEGRVTIMCGIFSEYGGADNYSNDISVDIEKGKKYYFRGEGKSIVQVSESEGQSEFENSSNFKGSTVLNDDKPSFYNSAVPAVNNTPAQTEVAAEQTLETKIVITAPKLVENEDFILKMPSVKLSGYVLSNNAIKHLTINAENINTDDVGNFSLQLNLKEGLNKVVIVATDDKQKQIKKSFNIVREQAEDVTEGEQQTSPTGDTKVPTYRGGSDPFKGTNVANATKELRVGKYYALLIGIDKYTGTWASLKNAVNDAKAIETVIKTQYKFESVKTLYNTEATRENIINEFEWLVANTKENDNVFIYYSGHGELKKELNKGYWVPIDAKTASTAQFISNSDIQTFLGGIPVKHTLLVSDACFSGDIFRGTTSSIPFENTEKHYTKTYDLKSRQAISSGGLEPVMDGGKEGHSVFAYYLLQALKSNGAKYFDATQLFSKIKIPVVNNSDQTPSFNPIKNTGDEGGNFIFIKK